MNSPQPDSLPRPRKRPGAQPGNTNALRHGFYSGRFNSHELSDLTNSLGEGLTDEIALLRVIIRRVFEFADLSASDLDDWTKSLNTLGAAATRLAGLLRTQHVLSGGGTDIVDILSQAIGDVANDLGIRDPAKY